MPTADELLGIEQVGELRKILRASSAEVPGRGIGEASALLGIGDQLADTPLKQRVDNIAAAVLSDLVGSFSYRAAVIRQALTRDDFHGWMIWPVSEAVSAASLEDATPEGFDQGMYLLADLTSRLTCEFAIRPMLNANLERALPIIREWTMHPDEHVRRLASEGTRMFLPWGRRVPELTRQPRITLPILNALYRDPSDMVRRSVANHLNDLSRNNADIVLETAAMWLAEPDKHTVRVVRHALRTLIKRGDQGALSLMGFEASDDVVTEGPFIATETVSVGGSLPFSLAVKNNGKYAVSVMVDYVIHHQKANGTQSAKVFKLATKTVAPGERIEFQRKHSFAPLSTRTYHPGEHSIEAQVNGVPLGKTSFMLTV
ncbi:DNA alkylation repair protein [Lysinibacter sp. HNR]|uniref:DNA alkylation repair protein n=1 Tax=Lysinibacter sp. HNR TaxID=3031408 RepID=UPI002434AC05|nr:DNA alkylation repair protein [Lysinibacter sp. HNR]WGD36518.1 DNA alkylation repair protein [Lysinibacter sp. HNR]